jgi:hypothetical protein
MTATESAGAFTMPPLVGILDGLWEVILDLADQLPPMSWALIGGQMVMAHGLAAGRTPTRASQDVDILGNLTASSTALRTAVAAVRDLGFEPEPSIDRQASPPFRPNQGPPGH